MKFTTAQWVGMCVAAVVVCLMAYIGYNTYHTIIGTPNPVKCAMVDQ